MTKQEARKQLKLKETDNIYKPGVQFILENRKEMLKTWSLSRSMREEINKDIEACEALLDD